MQDKIKTGFEGYFKIECIKDGKVIDSFEEHNTIMRSARRSMAEIFLNSKNNSKEFANKFILGTEGGYISEYFPKSEESGFNKDKMPQTTYAEEGFTAVDLGSSVDLKKFNVIKVDNQYYRYIDSDTQGVNISVNNLSNTTKFIKCSKPYVYKIDFSLEDPVSYTVGTNSNNKAIGDSLFRGCSVLTALSEEEEDLLDRTTCIFTFTIPKDQGNNQHSAADEGFYGATTLFTEAGLYVNDRLFSMKCFPAKVKDDSTEIKVTWKIIF